MRSLVLATAGFLLAVLWMDLMFDVQVRRFDAGEDQRDAALASIAAYYRRVTTDAFPMGHLIGTIMALQLWGIADEVLFHRTVGGWRALLLVALGVVPIGMAFFRIVPDAVRLGTGWDDPPTQRALAGSIYRNHVVCFAAIGAFIVLQLRLPA